MDSFWRVLTGRKLKGRLSAMQDMWLKLGSRESVPSQEKAGSCSPSRQVCAQVWTRISPKLLVLRVWESTYISLNFNSASAGENPVSIRPPVPEILWLRIRGMSDLHSRCDQTMQFRNYEKQPNAPNFDLNKNSFDWRGILAKKTHQDYENRLNGAYNVC